MSRSRAVGMAGVTVIGLGVAFWLDTRPLLSEAARPLDCDTDDPLNVLSPAALNDTMLHLVNKPLGHLLRTYVTLLGASTSTLVDLSSWTIEKLQSLRTALPLGIGEIPWSIASAVIRRTAFAMFAGGETAQGCYPLLDRLAQESTSGLLCYSAEAEELSPHKAAAEPLVESNIEETFRAIRAAGAYPSDQPSSMQVRPTWIAIKLTGLIRDPSILERASEALTSSSAYQRGQRLPDEPLFPPSPSLSEEDTVVLKELYDKLSACVALARQLRVRIDIDAEQSWFQPAIDRYYNLLATECNMSTGDLLSPIIYQTYQCYRSDARERMLSDQAWAKQKGLLFGAKLVRGAYVDSENARAKRLKRPSPLWPDKVATDTCYDACARDMTDAIAKEIKSGSALASGVMFASHNAHSTRLVLERFREAGLVRNDGNKLACDPRLAGRVVFGQLLGMADNLTAALTTLLGRDSVIEKDAAKREQPLAFVLKYIPYGPLDECMPYLVRRAQENKAILNGDNSRGGVRHDRKAVGREIRRRLLGGS